MKREKKCVAYSYEHGDNSLPHLKELVSDVPDIEKEKILSYLRLYCYIACGGIIEDEITPGKTIGHGNVFTDGTYYWNDAFIGYFEKYNIPVPLEFREHILKNFEPRMKRHKLLQNVDRVELLNNPLFGYKYSVCINRDGVVTYQNNIDCTDKAYIVLPPDIEAEYFIDPCMTELFCYDYDLDNHGTIVIDGYYWEIKFYCGTELVNTIEGRTGEDNRRYSEFLGIIEFIERFIHRSLGSEHMADLRKELGFDKIF